MKSAFLKIFILAFALVFLLAMLTSCMSGGDTKNIYYAVSSDFSGMDPQIVSSPSSQTVVFNCFEGLMRLDKNGEAKPAGAESYSVSDDGLTYTFNLRQDAVWYLTNTSKEEMTGVLPDSFDDKITADDYIFGIQRALSPETQSPGAQYLSAIKNAGDVLKGKKDKSALGIKKIGDYSLQIELSYPDSDFLYELTRPAAMPCDETFFSSTRGRYGLSMEYLLCNGPYIMWSWNGGTLVQLRKNSKYKGSFAAGYDAAYISVSNDDDIVDNLKGGSIDCGFADTLNVSEFENKSDYKVVSLPNELFAYRFNCADKIFENKDMRLAFASSVDTSLISVPSGADGGQNRLIIKSMPGYYDSTPELIKKDDSNAVDYFKKGAEKLNLGSGETVTVLTTDYMSESVQKQIQLWQKDFGIDVKINALPEEDAVNSYESGDYQVCFLPRAIGSYTTEDYFTTFSSESAENYENYKNDGYDKILSSVDNSMTQDEKQSVFAELEQTVISDAVVYPVFSESVYFVSDASASNAVCRSEGEIYF